MIKLIVGLGNPGQQYEKTRHNAGFLFLDYLMGLYSGNWVVESKFNGCVSTIFVEGKKVILLKPQTFMNRSGMSVRALAEYYKFAVDEILVVHDELDFEVGVMRLKRGGGHAGHNGLRDIIVNLGSKDFYRMRVGIGRPVSGKAVADYVLSKPSATDRDELQAVFERAGAQIEKIMNCEMSLAMNF